MRTLWVFALGGAISWLFRASFIALAPQGHVSAALVRTLKHAAPAAFAALIGVAVSDASHGSAGLTAGPVIAATAVTLTVALRTRNVLLTLAAGALAASGFSAW